jgi:hypothetical protein
VVIAFGASVWGVPAWADEPTQVRVLLTKFDDGDTRDAKLRSATAMIDKFGGNSENERPTDFSTDKGKEAVLFILKRVTK